MEKTCKNHRGKDAIKTALVKKTARITGVSARHVYRILSADRENEQVLDVYMRLLEFDNVLVDYVEKLVPLNKKAV